jgi:hypothetical protein
LLEAHRTIRNSGAQTLVLPTFRPDAALRMADPVRFNEWTNQLATVANVEILRLPDFLDALARTYFGRKALKLRPCCTWDLFTTSEWTSQRFCALTGRRWSRGRTVKLWPSPFYRESFLENVSNRVDTAVAEVWRVHALIEAEAEEAVRAG